MCLYQTNGWTSDIRLISLHQIRPKSLDNVWQSIVFFFFFFFFFNFWTMINIIWYSECMHYPYPLLEGGTGIICPLSFYLRTLTCAGYWVADSKSNIYIIPWQASSDIEDLRVNKLTSCICIDPYTSSDKWNWMLSDEIMKQRSQVLAISKLTWNECRNILWRKLEFCCNQYACQPICSK